jgi:sulfotransferase family protein
MKIFGLGFHKTGTTSLEVALTELGYRCCGGRPDLFSSFDAGEWDKLDEEISRFDGFRDMPWPLYFEALDARYTGSKFILTIRNEERWIRSCVNHYRGREREGFNLIYGEEHSAPLNNETKWLERYRSHNHAVIDYFREREADLLVLDWEEEGAWEKLCAFLDLEPPQSPVPYANKGEYTLLGKIRRKLKRVFRLEPKNG